MQNKFEELLAMYINGNKLDFYVIFSKMHNKNKYKFLQFVMEHDSNYLSKILTTLIVYSTYG